jgi:ankyrin repeat protein
MPPIFLLAPQMYADQKVSIPLIVRSADKNSLQELIELGDAGFSLSDASKGGLTPLHCAARNGYTDVCKHLLDNGCDPNAQDVFGDTALHISISYGHLACASLVAQQQLLQPDVCDKLGRSALHILAETYASAVLSDSLKALVESLLQKGFKADLADKMGRTASSIAKSEGLLALLKQ